MKNAALTLLVAAGVFAGCTKQKNQESQPSVVVDVKVAQLRMGSLDETVIVSGATMNQRESQLRSPINGIITKFQLFNGDTVRKGETLAVIQTKESQAAIQGAEKLLRTAATSSQRDEAEKALALAREGANNAIITAPFPGILSNKAKNEMEAIAEGEALASVIDPASIVFVADVPSHFLERVRKNQRVNIRFPSMPNKTYAGIVNRIDPQVNPNDQTARVQINFSQPITNIERSLFGDATILIGRKSNILLAPAVSVLHNDENNTTSIMVVRMDSLAHKIEIQVGTRQDSLTQILSKNLKAGDLVIVLGQYGLPDSTRVRIVQ